MPMIKVRKAAGPAIAASMAIGVGEDLAIMVMLGSGKSSDRL
ncbi:hypothetical protein FRZ44_19210 [Hypericibacter terrae]|uniref:Uncharacterized protein n=1 Tax=Hypericibacter terrae TaxID=2602015 RepID=A0A5J6MPC0_9PROT|nr:hypothetical protein FRZ44_19210 [Hypericibacter terrae]